MKNVMLFPFIVCIMFVTIFTACSSDEDIHSIPVSTILKDGMIKLTNDVGEWDANVIYEEDGYMFFKEKDEAVDNLYLQFKSPMGDYDCCVLANKSNFLPEILCFSDETYYFDNWGDTLVVSMATENKFEVLDSVSFEISGYKFFSKSGNKHLIINYLNRDDKILKVVRALDAILGASENYTSSQLNRLKKALNNISMFHYYENVEEIVDGLDLCRQEYGEKGDSVIYCFSQYATSAKVSTFNSARFAVTVQTRMGASVYCNSAVVSGRIFCPNDQVSEKGTWGIIYAKEPNDLRFESENANVEYATEMDFTVELRNLEANTTYYYATFYKFNTEDHGDLFHHFGRKDAEYYVGSWPNSFTTLDPIVKVVSITNNEPVSFNEGQYQDWYTGELYGHYIHCTIYPKIVVKLEGIKKVIGYSVEFQNSVPFSHSYENGPYPRDEEFYWDGLIGDKWSADQKISGNNKLRVIVYIKEGMEVREIRSEWKAIHYSYLTGVSSEE